MRRMPEQIVIERLEFRARCGVTPEERAKPQLLALDLRLDTLLHQAGQTDRLDQTIDYAAIIRRVVDTATAQEPALLETMAERILATLFDECPIEHAAVWLRKVHPPIRQIVASVGVSLSRTKREQLAGRAGAAAPWLHQHLARLPKGRALDVAAGNGRHSLLLASEGYDVDAVDRDPAALATLNQAAAQRADKGIATRLVDLEQPAPFDPGFGRETYDVIVVFFYLHRPLFPFLVDALKPGGVLLYETFTIDNHRRSGHPKRREFCLESNELLRLTAPLHLIHYDEGLHEGALGGGSAYTAQLIAQKPLTQAGHP